MVQIEEVLELKTPVILVAGISERTNKFEIQLSLRKRFLKMGYKVSQIGTRNYCEFFGFHSFPEFMLKNEISESHKVVLFNHYIKLIETNEKPDLVIIGIPGGVVLKSKGKNCANKKNDIHFRINSDTCVE